jgi:hypothetical protein
MKQQIDLPYRNSKTQPHLAKDRIHKTLLKFEVDEINFTQSFKRLDIRLTFICQDIPVSIPVNYGELAKRYAGGTEWDYVSEKEQKHAINAAYAIIEDFLKAMLVLHQLEIMTLQELFMPNLLDQNGVRLGEIVANRLPDFLEGRLLPESVESAKVKKLRPSETPTG